MVSFNFCFKDTWLAHMGDTKGVIAMFAVGTGIVRHMDNASEKQGN